MTESTTVPTDLALTGAQYGVWYAQQVDPENPVYNVGQYVDLSGDLDVPCFEAALSAVVAETEALRSRIVERGGVPVQQVRDRADRGLEQVDLRGGADLPETALDWMRRDMQTPVDLFTGPLHRFALLRVADDRYLWYQRFHHILADAYAITAFTRRVAEVYTRLSTTRESGLRPQDVPERKFGTLREVVAQEEAYAASGRHEADRAYWSGLLADRPEPVLLGDAPPAAPRAAAGVGGTADARVFDRLSALGEATGASWAEALIAAFGCYVHRRTGARDLVLGMPAMGRLGSAALRTPSMVVNILPLRLGVRPGDRVGDIVRHTADRLGELRAHHRYRAEDIRRDLALVGRSTGLYGPTVNIKAFDYDLDFAGIRGITHTLSEGPVDDVSLSVYRDTAGGGLRFELNGNAARYTRGDLITRLAEFQRLLDSLVGGTAHGESATPADLAERRVGALDLVSADTDEHALTGAVAHQSPDTCVGDLIAATARRVPDAVAVRAGGTDLTYAALDARADGLAARLRAAGAAPERVVAIALPRCADLVAALLAVGRTGAAYLPVDPEFPAERIAHMLTDSGADLLVTTAELAVGLPDGPRRILLDGQPDERPGRAGEGTDGIGDRGPVSADASAADHAAYVLYTSGSTGRPKGVVVSQGALLNFL
nr:condensation domain-containing protein [Nocardiopsaceae bacterium]